MVYVGNKFYDSVDSLRLFLPWGSKILTSKVFCKYVIKINKYLTYDEQPSAQTFHPSYMSKSPIECEAAQSSQKLKDAIFRKISFSTC